MSKTLPKQNFTSLLRRVRAILPGDVKKTDLLEYEVDGKVKINFNYYCRWRGVDLDKELKECHPVSIRISTATTYLDKQGYNPAKRKVFVTRTIPRQKAGGDFNLESVAVAVTRGIEAVDLFLKKRKEEERKYEAEQKLKEEMKVKLEKEFSAYGLKRQTGWGGRVIRFESQNDVVDLTVIGPNNNGEFHYDVQFSQLTKEELVSILQAVRIASQLKREDEEN